jgi:hypothetical protein
MAAIVGISGKRGVGKSLLCNPYLKARDFQIYAFADPLKEDVRRFYGLTRDHTDGKLKEEPCHKLGGRTPREAMIAEGLLRRQFSENGMYWVYKLFEDKIKKVPENTLIAISDVRFKNEANYIHKQGGYLVRLDRKLELNVHKGLINDPSENDLDDYNFDLRLTEAENITPQNLERFADRILECIAKSRKV